MYWKEFPAQVNAEDEQGVVKAMLPERFQQAIDAAAMAENSSDSDSYLAGWEWRPIKEKESNAQDTVKRLVAELKEAYPQDRLSKMI